VHLQPQLHEASVIKPATGGSSLREAQVSTRGAGCRTELNRPYRGRRAGAADRDHCQRHHRPPLPRRPAHLPGLQVRPVTRTCGCSTLGGRPGLCPREPSLERAPVRSGRAEGSPCGSATCGDSPGRRPARVHHRRHRLHQPDPARPGGHPARQRYTMGQANYYDLRRLRLKGLQRPLLAADQPPACRPPPLKLRRALRANDRHIDDYICHARLAV
jgi:hypothetical protein